MNQLMNQIILYNKYGLNEGKLLYYNIVAHNFKFFLILYYFQAIATAAQVVKDPSEAIKSLDVFFKLRTIFYSSLFTLFPIFKVDFIYYNISLGSVLSSLVLHFYW